MRQSFGGLNRHRVESSYPKTAGSLMAGQAMVRPAAGEPVEQRLLATARRRSALISEVSSAMAGSLNVRRSVLRLLDILCADFVDWAMVGLLDSSALRVELYGGENPRNL